MAKPYRIKQEIFDDEGLKDWNSKDLACFNLLDENGINIAEETAPDDLSTVR